MTDDTNCDADDDIVTVVDCRLEWSFAVIVAVWVDGMVPAVALKPALLAPIGTTTDDGIAKMALLSDN